LNDYIVNTDTLAGIFGCTGRWVQQMERDGILVRKAPGKWPVIENTTAYIKYLENNRKINDEDEADYWHEKALHEKAKRETTELRLSEYKKSLLSASEVEGFISEMIIVCRNRLLYIPDKIAVKITGLTDVTQVRKIIMDEVLEALNELKEYDPTAFTGGDDFGNGIETEINEPLESPGKKAGK